MTDFLDTLPPEVSIVHSPALERALLKDVARTFELLGVESLRAAVVELESMAINSQWSISELGEAAIGNSGQPLDSSFRGASAALGQLADADSNQTLTQQLNPKRWRLSWRMDERQAIVAEARFQERRDVIIEVDIVLLRLVCSMGVQVAQETDHGGDALLAGKVWPQRERRANARVSALEPQLRTSTSPSTAPLDASKLEMAAPNSPGTSWRAMLLLLISVMVAGWIALVAAPRGQEIAVIQQSEISRLRALSQDTMVLELSTAMVSGDYGQVQAVLSAFASLGYFTGAVVTNERQRVVALSGRAERLRIGDAVPPEVAHTSQAFDLKLGSQRHGRLLLVPAPPPITPTAPLAFLGWLAWAGFVAALLSALMVALRKPAWFPRQATGIFKAK